MKIKKSARQKYEWYLSCTRADETRPLPLSQQAECPNGVTAIESFHNFESHGRLLPTREPLLLERYIKGKEWHGVTIKTVAEDFAINRLVFSEEIKSNYPKWVAYEIFKQAKKIALKELGFVPTFVAIAKDFSEYNPAPRHSSDTSILPTQASNAGLG